MTLLTVFVAPLAALLGVVLGGVVTSRTQLQAALREHDRHEREAIRKACAAYLAATRRFTSYVKDMNTEIGVVPAPESGGSIHVLADPSFSLDLENSSAELLLVARTAQTVSSARSLRNALGALALSRAELPAAPLPHDRLAEIRATEIAFINAARAELGAPALEKGLYTRG